MGGRPTRRGRYHKTWWWRMSEPQKIFSRRVRLIRMTEDPDAPPPGTMGTVAYEDDKGTLLVQWDNGSTLGLIRGVDEWQEVGENGQ
jgi:hypothetical protein